jgi:hypothetical protein
MTTTAVTLGKLSGSNHLRSRRVLHAIATSGSHNYRYGLRLRSLADRPADAGARLGMTGCHGGSMSGANR